MKIYTSTCVLYFFIAKNNKFFIIITKVDIDKFYNFIFDHFYLFCK